MLAITKASLRAMFRSPSSIIFSIFFPLIFILGFGFIGNGGGRNFNLVLSPQSDTANEVIDSLRSLENIKFEEGKTGAEIESDLIKGRITGIIEVEKVPVQDTNYQYVVKFKSTSASADQFSSFMPLLENVIAKIDKVKFEDRKTYAKVVPEIRNVREYRTIDFILPGQLGFSLLSAGVFGVAFLFFNLRQQLVLKRFSATPVKRGYIVLGEGLSRVVFQLITAVIIIAVGHFAFKFTLVHGWLTFFEIMLLSFLALLVFMGFGFVVSGLAKTESSIPPFANLFTLPQFLLAGTFFSIDVFPWWLQPISRALPLTYFNDAMRKIAFEGAHLQDVWMPILILVGWGILAYAVAIKVFRWE